MILAAKGIFVLSLVWPPDVRLDFEKLPGQRLPSTWELDGWGFGEGYRSVVTQDSPRTGHYCLSLHFEGEGVPQGEGRLYHKLAADAYRGKRVAFRAGFRVMDSGTTARLLLTGTTRDQHKVLVAGTTREPIRSTEWELVELEGNVGPDLVELEMSLTHSGPGRVLVDDIELVVLGDLPDLERQASGELDDRELENVVVLGRLLGLLQYYHPSDQAAAADWWALAREGVLAVEGADDTIELSRLLEEHFAAVAPTLRVHPKAKPARKSSDALDPPEDGDHEVVRWHHVGLGGTQGAGEHFVSERERVPFEGKVPRKWMRPHKPLDFDVGGFVVGIVPTTLFADANGTLPHAEGEAAEARAVEASAGFTALDRATRLAIVILAWNALQHFSPLLEENRVDWEDELEVALADAARAGSEEELLRTLRRMVAKLEDSQAWVEHRSDWRPSNIPVAWDWVEDQLVITRVGESENNQIGVGVGDVVLQLSGNSAEALFREACLDFAGATEGVAHERALAALRRRDQPAVVKMRVNTARGARIDVNYSDPFARPAMAEPRPDQFATLDGGALYVNLGALRRAHLAEMGERVAAAERVVFDLRDGAADYTHREFLAQVVTEPIKDVEWRVPTTTRPNRDKVSWDKRSEKIEPAGEGTEAKLAFVADASTIGVAERVLGVAWAAKLGTVVGQPSGGTLGLTNSIRLPDGYVLEWTATLAKLPNGETLYREGVKPHKQVARTAKGVAADKDELLEAALEVLAER